MTIKLDYTGPLTEAEWKAICDLCEKHGTRHLFNAVATYFAQEQIWKDRGKQ